MLVEYFDLFNYIAVIGTFGVVALFRDCRFDLDCIADKDRANESDAVIAIGEGDRINLVGGHADADAQNQRTVGDTLLEFLGLHPFSVHVVGEEIIWEKRSLQEFADAPIQGLEEEYDLLVIDHPWAGYAAHSQVLLPLQEIIPADYMRDQAEHSVGQSHPSYIFDGAQCALAIDAATPVASYRPDLLDRYELVKPETWDDLLGLARQGGVIMPGIPIDTLMNFYMLCATQGEPPFTDDEWSISDTMGMQALEQLRELASLCPEEVYNWNPIAVYEALSRRDDYVYCPFAYGYSNYARAGYSDNVLIFDDMVNIHGQGRCQSTLGGTGLAISSRCQRPELARD